MDCGLTMMMVGTLFIASDLMPFTADASFASDFSGAALCLRLCQRRVGDREPRPGPWVVRSTSNARSPDPTMGQIPDPQSETAHSRRCGACAPKVNSHVVARLRCGEGKPWNVFLGGAIRTCRRGLTGRGSRR